MHSCLGQILVPIIVTQTITVNVLILNRASPLRVWCVDAIGLSVLNRGPEQHSEAVIEYWSAVLNYKLKSEFMQGFSISALYHFAASRVVARGKCKGLVRHLGALWLIELMTLCSLCSRTSHLAFIKPFGLECVSSRLKAQVTLNGPYCLISCLLVLHLILNQTWTGPVMFMLWKLEAEIPVGM